MGRLPCLCQLKGLISGLEKDGRKGEAAYWRKQYDRELRCTGRQGEHSDILLWDDDLYTFWEKLKGIDEELANKPKHVSPRPLQVSAAANSVATAKEEVQIAEGTVKHDDNDGNDVEDVGEDIEAMDLAKLQALVISELGSTKAAAVVEGQVMATSGQGTVDGKGGEERIAMLEPQANLAIIANQRKRSNIYELKQSAASTQDRRVCEVITLCMPAIAGAILASFSPVPPTPSCTSASSLAMTGCQGCTKCQACSRLMPYPSRLHSHYT